MNPQLDSYIQQARAAGQSDEQIKQALMQSGWTQVHINEAFGLPNPPSAPVVPPLPMRSAMSGSTMSGSVSPVAGEFFDHKTKETVIWSVVGYFIRSVIVGLATAIGAYMFFSSISVYGIAVPIHTGFYFNFGNVIINSIVGGLIFGIILAKYYSKVREINHKFFGGWFHDLYRLIFYPAIIAGVLGLLFAGAFSFLGGQFFLYILTIIVGDIVGAYIFAKLMVSKVGQFYPAGK